jgi:hypothetical protein
VIRTDQQSLKYMMQQRLTEGIQHKLLMKLLEFNYTIEYKKGAQNAVADALPCKEHKLLAIYPLLLLGYKKLNKAISKTHSILRPYNKCSLMQKQCRIILSTQGS